MFLIHKSIINIQFNSKYNLFSNALGRVDQGVFFKKKSSNKIERFFKVSKTNCHLDKEKQVCCVISVCGLCMCVCVKKWIKDV